MLSPDSIKNHNALPAGTHALDCLTVYREAWRECLHDGGTVGEAIVYARQRHDQAVQRTVDSVGLD
jgi:hypothetical protein